MIATNNATTARSIGSAYATEGAAAADVVVVETGGAASVAAAGQHARASALMIVVNITGVLHATAAG